MKHEIFAANPQSIDETKVHADQKHPTCDTTGDAAADYWKFRATFWPVHCARGGHFIKKIILYLTDKSVLFSMIFVSFFYLHYFSYNSKFKSILFFKLPSTFFCSWTSRISDCLKEGKFLIKSPSVYEKVFPMQMRNKWKRCGIFIGIKYRGICANTGVGNIVIFPSCVKKPSNEPINTSIIAAAEKQLRYDVYCISVWEISDSRQSCIACLKPTGPSQHYHIERFKEVLNLFTIMQSGKKNSIRQWMEFLPSRKTS